VQPINAAPRDWADTPDEQARIKSLLQGDAAIAVSYGADRWYRSGSRLVKGEDLTPYMSAGSRIDSSPLATIQRTCQLNFDSTITASGSPLKYLTDLVAPYMVISNPNTGTSARFNLGKYTLESPTYDNASSPAVVAFSGVDVVGLLDVPIYAGEVADVGADPVVAAANIIARYLPWLDVRVDPSSYILSQPRAYPSGGGWTYLTAVNDLLATANYLPVWADWDGTLRLTPAPQWVFPTLPNPGFEQLDAGWLLGPATFLSTAQKHSGAVSAAVNVTTSVPGTNWGLSAPKPPPGTARTPSLGRVAPGDQFTLSVWMRAEGVNRPVTVQIVWLDAYGSAVSTSATSPTLLAGSWIEVSLTATAPAGTEGLAVAAAFPNDATTGLHGYIDDFTLTKITKRPAEWLFDTSQKDTTLSATRTSTQDIAHVPNLWTFYMQDAPTLDEGATQFTYIDATQFYADAAAIPNYSGADALDHPGSIDNRNRIVYADTVAVPVPDPTVASYALLRDVALGTINAALQPGETFNVTASPLPLLWHWDYIEYRDSNLAAVPPAYDERRFAMVTQWTLPLGGEDMTMQWQTISVDPT
jgi:hypothetical protein